MNKNSLTDDSCSSICKSLSRSSTLNDARFAVLIDEPFDDIGTSSSTGRLARLGYPADIAIDESVVRLFDALADETAGFSGFKTKKKELGILVERNRDST